MVGGAHPTGSREIADTSTLKLRDCYSLTTLETTRVITFAGLNSAQQAFAYTPKAEAGVIIPNGKAAPEPKNSGRDSYWFALDPQVITQL
jgi:hypothetical protein